MDDKNKFMNKISFRNKKGGSNYNSFIVNFPRGESMVDIAEVRYLNGRHVYLLPVLIFFEVCLLKCRIKVQTLQQLY